MAERACFLPIIAEVLVNSIHCTAQSPPLRRKFNRLLRDKDKADAFQSGKSLTPYEKVHSKLWEFLQRELRDIVTPRPVVGAGFPQHVPPSMAGFEHNDMLHDGSATDANDAFSVLEDEEGYDSAFAALEDECCGSEIDSDLLEDDAEYDIRCEEEQMVEQLSQAWATQGSNEEDTDLCSLLEEEDFGIGDGSDTSYTLLDPGESMLIDVCQISPGQFKAAHIS